MWLQFKYDESIMLPQGLILQNAPSPVMALAIVMEVMASVTLIIMERRRALTNKIKRPVVSVQSKD